MWPFSRSREQEAPPIAQFRLVGDVAEEFLRLHDQAVKERREGLHLAEFKMWEYLGDKIGYGVDYRVRFYIESESVLVLVLRRYNQPSDVKVIAI